MGKRKQPESSPSTFLGKEEIEEATRFLRENGYPVTPEEIIEAVGFLRAVRALEDEGRIEALGQGNYRLKPRH